MDDIDSARQWAREEFGGARLNDRRNVDLLVRMAAGVVARPHATVAKVFPEAAEQQAAYDFLENPRITPDALVQASAEACARRSAEHEIVLIAADGCCLTLRDPYDVRGTGSVGKRTNGARGLHVIDAVAMSERGGVLGLAGLVCWARSLKRSTRHYKLRSIATKETMHWLRLRSQVRTAFSKYASSTLRVFLHDSGADAWPVLLDIFAHDLGEGEYTVVRASHNRRARAESEELSNLRTLLRRAPLHARYHEEVGAGHGRTPRKALFELRAQRVTLALKCRPGFGQQQVPLYAIWLRERGRIPRGQERLEWMLLTSWPITTIAQARRVVRWYQLRWRVEDQHKCWKRSGSDIESTKLRSRSAIERWMTLHAAASARALQLIHAARDPELGQRPAEDVFSRNELRALRALRRAARQETPDKPTVEQAVTMVAAQGGYVPAKGRRPGPTVLQRGLERLDIATEVVNNIDAEKLAEKLRPK